MLAVLCVVFATLSCCVLTRAADVTQASLSVYSSINETTSSHFGTYEGNYVWFSSRNTLRAVIGQPNNSTANDEASALPWAHVLRIAPSDINAAANAVARNGGSALIIGDMDAYVDRTDPKLPAGFVVVLVEPDTAEQLFACLQSSGPCSVEIAILEGASESRTAAVIRTVLLSAMGLFTIIFIAAYHRRAQRRALVELESLQVIQSVGELNATPFIGKYLAVLEVLIYERERRSYETESCIVCLDDLVDGDRVRALPCDHIFHEVCIDPWLLKHHSCPLCKLDLAQSVIVGGDAVANAIAELKSSQSCATDALPRQPATEFPEHIQLIGSQGSLSSNSSNDSALHLTGETVLSVHL